VLNTEVYPTERNHRKSVQTPAATETTMIRAMIPATIGMSLFGHRGSTMGRPTGGLDWPGDRKVTPSPLDDLGHGTR